MTRRTLGVVRPGSSLRRTALRHSPRRGALLPAVLAVMTLIGLAASAAYYMSLGERTASAAARLQTSAIAGADEAEVVALASMAPLAARLEPGGGIARTLPVTNAGVTATGRLIRAGTSTFALAVDARATDAAERVARRRSSLMLRLHPARVDFPAALTVADLGAMLDDVADGRDQSPPGWPCDPDTASVPDVRRDPDAARDSAVLRQLRERAAIRLSAGTVASGPAPVVRDGECDVAHPANWGDPRRTTACATWVPIIHSAGNLTVLGGSGQGTLIVDGDLRVAGGFEFAGAVVVAGTLEIGVGGAVLTGGVKAHRVVDADGAGSSSAPIRRSGCAVRAALTAAGTLARAGDRPWAAER